MAHLKKPAFCSMRSLIEDFSGLLKISGKFRHRDFRRKKSFITLATGGKKEPKKFLLIQFLVLSTEPVQYFLLFQPDPVRYI